MHLLALQTAAEGGGQIEQIARTFGVDWPHLVAQIISFGIVCAVLYALAYKPILRMLEARRAADRRRPRQRRRRSRPSWRASKPSGTTILREGRRRGQAADRGRARRGRAGPGRGDAEGRWPPPNRSSSARARPPSAIAPGCSPSCRREVGRLVVQTTATVTGKILTAETTAGWPRKRPVSCVVSAG